MADETSNHQINPITDEQAEMLQQFMEQIPKVQQIVKECEECEVQIPGVSESLARSLRLSTALHNLWKKHKV